MGWPEALRRRYDLPPDATEEDLRKALRRARQRWHPDKHMHDEPVAKAHAQRMFAQAQADFAIVFRPESATARQARQAQDKSPPPGRPPPTNGTTAGTNVWGAAADILRATTEALKEMRRSAKDVREPVSVPLATAWGGGWVTVSVSAAKPSPLSSRGWSLKTRTLRVRIPPGVKPGDVVRVPGAGHQWSLSETPGHAWLTVSWRNRKGWRWNGTSLHCTRYLPSRIAKSGGLVWIRGPAGRVAQVRIPPSAAKPGPNWSLQMRVPLWAKQGVDVSITWRSAHFWRVPAWRTRQAGRAMAHAYQSGPWPKRIRGCRMFASRWFGFPEPD